MESLVTEYQAFLCLELLDINLGQGGLFGCLPSFQARYNQISASRPGLFVKLLASFYLIDCKSNHSLQFFYL